MTTSTTASVVSVATALTPAAERAAQRLADPAALQRALQDVTFHVPPENQGQIVEVAYGSDCAGLVFRRTFDRSDRSTCYAVADVEDCGCGSPCSCFEPWNSEPFYFDWVSIEQPAAEEPAASVEYTFSIFDCNPASSGDAWPHYNGEQVPEEYCGSPEEALEHALDVAKDEGESCGEYAAGTRLWVIVYGPDQSYTGSVELDGDDDESDGESDDN